MAVWRYVKLDIKEAQLLADLTGIKTDLEATVAICDRLCTALEQSPDLVMIEAFTAAALTRYARSFVSGVRERVPDQLFEGLSNDQLDDHRWFKALRDKYIAHSVNAFEENSVVAYLPPEERGTHGVSSIEVQQHRLASLGMDDINRLKILCQHFISKVSQLIETERESVLARARQLPVDDLYSQNDEPVKVADRADVEKRRKR